MTGLSPTARALLDAARGGLSPDAAATARVRDKVAAAAGGAAIGGASAKLAIAGKLAALAAVIGIAAAVYVMTRDESEPPANPALAIERREPATPAVERPAATSSSREPTRPATSPPSRHDESTSPPSRNDVKRAAPRVGEKHVDPAVSKPGVEPKAVAIDPAIELEPAPVKSAASLAREVALIDRAMGALRRGDHAAAVDAITIYDRETAGRGQLAEDAAAIAVEAMCQRGDAAAAAKLDAFDRRWPHSAQRSRLSAACHR